MYTIILQHYIGDPFAGTNKIVDIKSYKLHSCATVAGISADCSPETRNVNGHEKLLLYYFISCRIYSCDNNKMYRNWLNFQQT